MRLADLLRELIEGGFVGQAIIATLLLAGYVYMTVSGVVVPKEYEMLTAAVVAWFFRSQAQVYADARARKQAKAAEGEDRETVIPF